MPPVERRRSIKSPKRLFGIDFNVPVTWVVTIVVMGLIEFGAFYSQFQAVKENVAEIKTILKSSSELLSVGVQRNLLQDERLDEHERRLNRHDELLEGHGRRRLGGRYGIEIGPGTYRAGNDFWAPVCRREAGVLYLGGHAPGNCWSSCIRVEGAKQDCNIRGALPRYRGTVWTFRS